MSTFKRVAVIMAGGVGERFWPVSRPGRPKQLLRLSRTGRTLLEDAVDRLVSIAREEDVYIATTRELLRAIQGADARVRSENVLGEPCRRNTAGCLVWAAANLLSRETDPAKISMAVVTADHIIGGADRFAQAVRASLAFAEKNGSLVVHGVVPTRPETGYGYVQAAERGAPLYDADGIRIFGVVKFHEKPDRETAEVYVARGDCYWNAGMFFWRLDTFLSELMLVQPEMCEATYRIADAFRQGDHDTANRLFENLPSLSIDVALMEKTQNVAVVRADYPWDDVGSWLSLERTHNADKDGNVAVGRPKLIDCRNSIVYIEEGARAQPVSVVGAEGLIVVVSENGVLVTPKNRVQDIRDAVQ